MKEIKYTILCFMGEIQWFHFITVSDPVPTFKHVAVPVPVPLVQKLRFLRFRSGSTTLIESFPFRCSKTRRRGTRRSWWAWRRAWTRPSPPSPSSATSSASIPGQSRRRRSAWNSSRVPSRPLGRCNTSSKTIHLYQWTIILHLWLAGMTKINQLTFLSYSKLALTGREICKWLCKLGGTLKKIYKPGSMLF